jgi:hypothetical protein
VTILQHYTSELHLPLILATGFLKVTESNIGAPQGRDPEVERRWKDGPHGDHYGPDVVWLTNSLRPQGFSLGLAGSVADKTMVRISVEVDDAEPFPRWAKAQGINRSWYHAMTKKRDPDSWYVLPREIHWEDWTEIVAGGKVAWEPQMGDPTTMPGALEFRQKMSNLPRQKVVSEKTGDGADAVVIRKEEQDA